MLAGPYASTRFCATSPSLCRQSPSPSRSTPQERRSAILRQRVADLFRGEAESPVGNRKTRDHYGEIDATKPSQNEQGHRYQRHGDDDNNHDDDDNYMHDYQDGQSTRWKKQSPLDGSRGKVNRAGFGKNRGLTTGADSQTRRGIEGAEEEGEHHAEGESAGRVAELGRRIAMRCLHVEQECFRRERAQTRLFQEQLCGTRQVISVAASRAILPFISIIVVCGCALACRACALARHRPTVLPVKSNLDLNILTFIFNLCRWDADAFLMRVSST